jgi:phosphogluconate dehydratase
VLTTVSVPDLAARPAATRSQVQAEGAAWGYGRELFGAFRQMVGTAEAGASICFASPGSMNGHADAPPDANLLDRMVDA